MDFNKYTGIIEFEVINSNDESSSAGDKLKLSLFGTYCPDFSMIHYSLKELLESPGNYKPTRILDRGKVIDVKIKKTGEK